MPVTYHIDREKRWLEVKLSGQVAAEEALENIRRMFADSDYTDDLPGVIDAREMINVFNVNELRGLADVQLARPGPAWRSRRAVVVASPAHYGTARVFMVFAEAGPVQYGVFYTMDSALEWLKE